MIATSLPSIGGRFIASLVCGFLLGSIPSASTATQVPAPPLPPPVEEGLEHERATKAQREKEASYRTFLEKCATIRSNALSHVNQIAVVEYTGEHKEWRALSLLAEAKG